MGVVGDGGRSYLRAEDPPKNFAPVRVLIPQAKGCPNTYKSLQIRSPLHCFLYSGTCQGPQKTCRLCGSARRRGNRYSKPPRWCTASELLSRENSYQRIYSRPRGQYFQTITRGGCLLIKLTRVFSKNSCRTICRLTQLRGQESTASKLVTVAEVAWIATEISTL